MPFRISGRNIDVGEALRARVSARIAEAMGKYFDGGYSGHGRLDKEGVSFRSDGVAHLHSGIALQVEGLAADTSASADEAAIWIETRRRRYDRGLMDHQIASADGGENASAPDVEAPSYVIAA